MKLKKIRVVTAVFASLFVAMLIFSLLPLFKITVETTNLETGKKEVEEKRVNLWKFAAQAQNTDVELELLDGEKMITTKLTNFYIFEPVPRSGIKSIEVKNEYGGYKVYRDAADAFQLDGYPGIQFDQELFSSLVVTAGTPTAMMRVAEDLDEAGYAEYGLDHPRASWTLTATDGKTYTIYVGDNLLTEGGYYVKYEPRNAVYILSTSLEDTILQPAHHLISPMLTAGLTSNTYFFVNEFTVMHGEDLFVHVVRVPEDQMSNPDGIVEVKLTWPRPENASNGGIYQINDDLYFKILYDFMALKGDEVAAFMPSDEELAAYGLEEPAYTVYYTFDLEGQAADVLMFVSEVQPDGGYYAVSNLYGFNVVIHVPGETLGWLNYDAFSWIFATPFFENITNVSRITLKGADIDVDYRLTHGTAGENVPTLDVVEVNSGTVIPNAEVNNFRQYYKTMLNITNQEYAKLSEEDREALIADESRVRLTMTYEDAKGVTTEFKFYQYYSASENHISGGKIFVVVNGVGEFYTTNDLIDKVVNDTARVLDGLDVDAYGQN
ncbi:MAG: DUF4340 domain-containing protein [Clostridia bacterium]|nr:DUF4340 domain-containing protein [Clostridia bacterium]